MNKFIIATDGACKGNPGPGGWGAIITDPSHMISELYGAEKLTTNNRMELMAAVEALSAIPEHSEIELITDSTYLKNGITNWINSWLVNGWRTANRSPVKNVELWKKLYLLTNKHTIVWKWQKAHVGHVMNERADTLANLAINNLLKNL